MNQDLIHYKIITLKRYFIFLLFGLILFPAVIFAEDGKDSLSVPSIAYYKSYTSSTFLCKNYAGSANFTDGLSSSSNNAPKTKKNWFKAMRYSGWARFYPMYRKMTSYYDIAPESGLTLPVNISADDGYQQPMMLITMQASPTSKTSFLFELQFDNLLRRTTNLTDSTGKLANLYVLFNLQGDIDTRVGHFKLTAGGGSNWFRMSPSTFWGYQYRDDLFERYPWEPEGHDFARYTSAYAVGDMPRDQRFGKQATQGFILEGTNLPHGFDAAVVYGKAVTSGGFQSYLTQSPINILGIRVGKVVGAHKIGVNYFNQFGYNDNYVVYKPIVNGTDTFYVEDNHISQIVTTVDGSFQFNKFSLFTELGAGSYLSSTYNEGLKEGAKPGVGNVSKYKRKWDETLFLEITTKKNFLPIIFKASVYRIGANVVNTNSAVLNTSVESAQPAINTPNKYYTNYFDGVVTDVGQMANNRQGLNITASKSFFNRLSTKLGLSMTQEIVNQYGDLRNGARIGSDSVADNPYTNSISFEHRLNGLSRSRFAFAQRFTGPYGRIQSLYRRTYENIAITDTIVDYKKSFSVIDLDLKYKTRFLGKEIIFTSFSIFSSVQEQWSPIPVMSEKAFIRIFYEEFMTFYAVHPKLTLVGFLGMERVIGNSRTELADDKGQLIIDSQNRPVASPNGKAVNQTGFGYGLGFDYNFHSRASLNMRNRWYSHQDKNFTLDTFRGYEATMEFKVFF